MGPILLCAGVVFVLIGVAMVVSQGGSRQTAADEAPRPRSASGQRQRRDSPPDLAPITFTRQADSMQAQFFHAKLGQSITFNHPERGGVTGQILGTIEYAELWQRRKAPSEPWTPTGNSFAAHWLGSQLLYEWQGRLYVLDEYQPLSDAEVQQSFLPYAKRFAQSNQTAQVSFAWPPASWTIADIGKFRVTRAEGQGLRLNAGAEGRFIHCKGADRRALVVEDYQAGQGGQDTAWIGYTLNWEDIQKIG
ncbi:MAG: hypothetical protein IT317_16510 [Anaerolineales bacterium]|nr:hypothetical protein [Anaerolineales bacterium]